MTHQFSAEILITGMNPYVDIPEEISKAFAKKGYIPVRGLFEGAPYQANLVPIGGGRHRLFLNKPMRKAAGLDVGSRATFTIEIDHQPVTYPMRPEFARALEQNPEAHEAFERLTPSHQKNINRYLNRIISPEILQDNIEMVLDALTGHPHGSAILRGMK